MTQDTPFDFKLKSDQHHYRTDGGLAYCGAMLEGLVMAWEDLSVVNCPDCLAKLEEDRVAKLKRLEDEADD